jgi:hypothetical protein
MTKHNLILYSRDLSEYVSDHSKFRLSKFKNKYIYIPILGKINPKLYYSLNKHEFNESKLYIGNNKFIKIGNNIYIRFEGNTHFITNKWFINTIKKINSNYKKIFGEIKPLYFQIKQIKNPINTDQFGGVASDHGIELVFHCYNIPDKNTIKWLIAHEVFHLYFPPLNNKYKYSLCWNEGLVDYLSLYLNFTNKQIKNMIHNKIDEFKNIDKIKEKEYYNHKKPYINGLQIGYSLSKSKLNKIITFIKKYNKNRKYVLEQIEDINFVKEMGFYNK